MKYVQVYERVFLYNVAYTKASTSLFHTDEINVKKMPEKYITQLNLLYHISGENTSITVT